MMGDEFQNASVRPAGSSVYGLLLALTLCTIFHTSCFGPKTVRHGQCSRNRKPILPVVAVVSGAKVSK